jgi:hypothetical protein
VQLGSPTQTLVKTDAAVGELQVPTEELELTG